ncbi:hypothetical protein BG011_001375 [Mortierella polycephala]|uniref:Methyltransferase-domain-containing protein n=1 Tax=Mortierella polycephala TaxID=41804 RepID=A0A9P6Q8X9_9FUNG|nr:hypothetical protein BG011_001375 [Mortierella polycephala]
MSEPRPMLMIEGPKFSGFDFLQESTGVSRGEPFLINGRRIVLPPKSVTQEGEGDPDTDTGNMKEDGTSLLSHTASTAKSVWDCSIVLSKYLEALSLKKRDFWTGKRVLELGAGQGIVSLSVAALNAQRVIITDIDSAVPSLQQGVKLNGFGSPRVEVTALDWTDRTDALQRAWNHLAVPSGTKPRLDYILASDVIWVEYLIPALVDTIAGLMHGPKTEGGEKASSPVLLLAYQFRSTRSDQLLFDNLDRLGLKRRKLFLDGSAREQDQDDVLLDPEYRKSNLAIWRVWMEQDKAM